ncbi:MAG: tetratricopeptide repeat protein, partial [Lentisphaerae bacterium]|nr:tetratricopeptide repeat protein [Lentisphaerota bacterium]
MTRQHDHTTPAHRGSTRGSAPRRLGAMALAMALAWSGSARADSARTMVRRGNDAYAAGRYEEAMKAYDQADVESPESPVVAFNRGAALYRTGDVAAAREAFSEAARRSRDPAFEAQCRYNIGNGWFQEARRQKDSDLAKAIEACEHSVDNYQAALVLEPEM